MSKSKKSNISLSDSIQNSDIYTSVDISDEEIDLANDDYDVELETISDDEENKNKETSNDGEKTILKKDKRRKNKYTSLSDEELSDNETKFDEKYIDNFTSDQYKLKLMNPRELVEDMQVIPKVYKNVISESPIDYIKYRILEKHKSQNEYISTINKYKTSHILQKAEMTEIIGIRAEHISRGAEPYIDIINETNPLQIAIKELKNKKCPLLLKRIINSFESEIWNPNEMTIVWDI